MAKLKHKIHLISLTHWDREWRFPFEETRMLLVEMMDGLLDLLDRESAYRHYHLDGQSILLEDYLEARPENRDRLAKRVREGRILIGPWYTLPAVSMVDGESLIRNFLIGAKVCAAFGRRMDVGYTPAGYGQPSQMPQILRNFGIDSAMFYRGINRRVCPSAEYWWEGPDGSRVLGLRLGDYARANFFYFVYRPVVHDRDNTKMTHHWEDGGLPVRLCDGRSTTCYYVLESAGGFFGENVADSLARLDSEEIRGTRTPYGLAMQCDDSVEADAAEVRIIEEANRRLGTGSIVHSSLPEYVGRVREHVVTNDVALDVLTGEMRHTLDEGVWTDLYPSVLGNRPDVRQDHRRSEIDLTRWAEPWATIAWMLGREYPAFYLERAWKLLLANQAHDSLNGGSMDRINHETAVRNEKIQTLAGGVRRRALEEIVRRIDTSAESPRDIFLIAFNPVPRDRDAVVRATLDFPLEWGVTRYRLTDMDGKDLPFQEVSAVEDKATFQRPSELPLRLPVRRHTVFFLARGLGGMGYRTYRVEAGAAPRQRPGSMATGPATIENEFLRVSGNPNGTIDLVHKATGRAFRQLNHFDDISEVGDPWTGRHSRKEQPVLSTDCRAEVEIVEDGPLSASIRTKIVLPLPGWSDTERRSAECVDLRGRQRRQGRPGGPSQGADPVRGAGPPRPPRRPDADAVLPDAEPRPHRRVPRPGGLPDAGRDSAGVLAVPSRGLLGRGGGGGGGARLPAWAAGRSGGPMRRPPARGPPARAFLPDRRPAEHCPGRAETQRGRRRRHLPPVQSRGPPHRGGSFPGLPGRGCPGGPGR